MANIRKAIREGNPEELRKLLAKNSTDINQKEFGDTQLMTAIQSPTNLEAVKILLEFGADQSSLDQGKLTAYDRAEVMGFTHLLEVLDSRYCRLGTLAAAIAEDKPSSLLSLFPRLSFPEKINQPFPFVSPSVELDYELQIQRPDEKIAQSRYLVQYAAERNRVKCLEILKSRGARMDDKVAYLLANDETRKTPNLFDTSQMMRSLGHGHSRFLDILLTNHRELLLDEIDENGETPLIRAVRSGNIEFVKVLLAHGANQSIPDPRGNTAYDLSDIVDTTIRDLLDPQYATIGLFFANTEKTLHIKPIKELKDQRFIFGYFGDQQSPVQVLIKLKHEKRNFEAEAALYRRVGEITASVVDSMLQCLHTHYAEPLYHVLELCGEDLRQYYKVPVAVRTGPLLEAILSAVFLLHNEVKFIHGDLKPENILVQQLPNVEFSCKLAHFDNSCPLGDPFPRVGGELIITETWTSPELYRAKVNNDLKVYGSAAMDVFNLGLIIDLLSRPTNDLTPDFTVINSDPMTRERLFHEESESEFFTTIYSLRNDHFFGELVQQMLTFDPNQRYDINRCREEFQKQSLEHVYKALRQSQRNLEQLKSISEQFNEQKLTLEKISNGINNMTQLLQQKFNNLKTTTMSLLEAFKSDFSLSLSEELKAILSSLESRIIASNTAAASSAESTLLGNLESMITTKMNLMTIQLTKDMEQNEATREKLGKLESNLQSQNEQLKIMSTQVQLLTTNTNGFISKIESLAELATVTSQNLQSLLATAVTSQELQVFCEELKDNFNEKIVGIVSEVRGEAKDEINSVKEQIQALGSYMNAADKQNADRLDQNKEEIKAMLETLNKTILQQALEVQMNNQILQSFIVDLIDKRMPVLPSPAASADVMSSSIDDQSQATNTRLDSPLTLHENLFPEIQQLAKDLHIHNTTVKSLFSEAIAKIEAVRNFQDLDVYDAHSYPFLFVISNEKLIDSVQNSMIGGFVDAVRNVFNRHYRVHFCCNVCGKVANSGPKKNPENVSGMSFVDQEQGGYKLELMKVSVAKFFDHAKWALIALEWGARLSGIPIPPVFSTVTKELCLTDDMKKIAKHLDDHIPPINEKTQDGLISFFKNPMSKILNNNDNGNGNNDKGIRATAVTKQMSDQEAREQQQEILVGQWLSSKPIFTLEHIRFAKELLAAVDDKEVRHTGLQRVSHVDGTCAWVCEDGEISRRSKPGKTLTCAELFKEEGYDCCLGGLENLLTNKIKDIRGQQQRSQQQQNQKMPATSTPPPPVPSSQLP